MTSRPGRAAAWVAAVLGVSLLLAGCSGTADDEPGARTAGAPDAGDAGDAADQDGHAGHAGQDGGTAERPRSQPLREGERFSRLAMPQPYRPSAPFGEGTDDYRCFLLDPRLEEDAFITGLDVLPGTPGTVHHVILFRVPPESVGTAKDVDRGEKGQGWTCFGGTGIGGEDLDDAPWLGAWAPGGGERALADDLGIPLEKGSQVVMQVHYNLLAGRKADVTSTRLRLASGDKDLAALETVLLPAPVELPCRAAHSDGELCDRSAAMRDVQDRFGDAGRTGNFLHLLCGNQPPGPVQRCERTIGRPATLRAVAGHMHLLGRSITVDVNPGTAREQRVLDIPVWDFDNQRSRPVEPVALRRGDTVRVTCEHDQELRDVLPAFEGQQERYVVWGEGTTDEMCLGLLMVTRP